MHKQGKEREGGSILEASHGLIAENFVRLGAGGTGGNPDFGCLRVAVDGAGKEGFLSLPCSGDRMMRFVLFYRFGVCCMLTASFDGHLRFRILKI